MREYDKLPKDLRIWVSSAVLPWRAQSVQTAYDKAIARTGNAKLALLELDKLQLTLVAKDASRVWGRDHPDARPVNS